MPMYLCRWPNGDCSVVQARNEQDAIIKLDEVANPEGCPLIPLQQFQVHFHLTDNGQLDLSVTWPAHGWLLAVAVGSQVTGWMLIGAALPRLPALETSVVLLLQPMLTMVWAWLLFAERLSASQGLGMALVLGGVGWLSVRGSVSQAEPVLQAAEGPALAKAEA